MTGVFKEWSVEALLHTSLPVAISPGARSLGVTSALSLAVAQTALNESQDSKN